MPIKVINKAKIKTEKIAFKLEDSKSADLMVQSFEYVPYVYIKKIDAKDPKIDGTSVDPRDIIYIKLHNSKFLPEIELYCYDSKGILFNDMYPFDHDTLVCIFVKSNSENSMPIRMDFRVSEYETVKADGDRETYKYLIKGLLNVDDLHYTKFESYKDTSYKVLKTISENMRLGFASNVNLSNDKMVWVNPACTYRKFIEHITKHSFISKEDFVWTFIDFYYNLNYINVQLELNEFNKDEEGTITDKKTEKSNDEKNVILYLTNNKMYNMTNKYISKFNLVNQSFKVNLEKNYRMVGTWYDKADNEVYKEYLEELKNDEGNLNKDEGKLKQLNDKDSDIFESNIDGEFVGKIDTDDNVHKNYAYAKFLNKFNLENMQKMKMVVTLTQINFSIKRFQNIKIDIYNPQDIASKNASKKKPTENINTRLSGYWYVTGINYLYKRSGGVEQEVTLMRRDLSINYGNPK